MANHEIASFRCHSDQSEDVRIMIKRKAESDSENFDTYCMDAAESVYLQTGDLIHIGIGNESFEGGEVTKERYYSLKVMTEPHRLVNSSDIQDWTLTTDALRNIERSLGKFYSFDNTNCPIYQYQEMSTSRKFEVQFKHDMIPENRIHRERFNIHMYLPFEKGGYSALYKFKNNFDREKKYALKCPLSRSGKKDTEVEMKQLARLGGAPHVVYPIRFVDFKKTTPLLLMPYAHYRDLDKFLEEIFTNKSETLPVTNDNPNLPTIFFDIILQVAIALQYAHEKHIAHCDLKPKNILIENWDPRRKLFNVCVSDFNSSKSYGDDGLLMASGSTSHWRYLFRNLCSRILYFNSLTISY